MIEQPAAHQPAAHQPGNHEAPNDRAAQQHERSALGEHATGDIVIDASLQDLQNAQGDDLDRQLEAGAAVHTTLQGRLSDLGGA